MKLNIFSLIAGFLMITSVFTPWFSVQTSTHTHSQAYVPLVFNLGILHSYTEGYLDLTSPQTWIHVVLAVIVISGIVCFFNSFLGGILGIFGLASFLIISPHIYLLWAADLTYVGWFTFSISLSYGFFLALTGCLLALISHVYLKRFDFQFSI